jgi:hypothetical protein
MPELGDLLLLRLGERRKQTPHPGLLARRVNE